MDGWIGGWVGFLRLLPCLLLGFFLQKRGKPKMSPAFLISEFIIYRATLETYGSGASYEYDLLLLTETERWSNGAGTCLFVQEQAVVLAAADSFHFHPPPCPALRAHALPPLSCADLI
jgi:hypothetical protein